MMPLFLTLLLGHLLSDFPLQTNWLARMKQNSHWGVLIHVVIYTVVTALLLEHPEDHIFLLVSLGAAHWLIDTIKMNSKNVCNLRSFVLDQAAHLGCLLLATGIVAYTATTLPTGIFSGELLYLADSVALIISIMVMIWVWACSTDAETVLPDRLVRWTQQQMLSISQRLGLVLVGSVAVRLIF